MLESFQSFHSILSLFPFILPCRTQNRVFVLFLPGRTISTALFIYPEVILTFCSIGSEIKKNRFWINQARGNIGLWENTGLGWIGWAVLKRIRNYSITSISMAFRILGCSFSLEEGSYWRIRGKNSNWKRTWISNCFKWNIFSSWRHQLHMWNL